MVWVQDCVWTAGIIVALLAQYLILIYRRYYLFVQGLVQGEILQHGLLVQHVQWTEDRLPAVIATLSLFYLMRKLPG